MTLPQYLSDYYSGANGLRDLLRKTQSYTEQLPLKLQAMEELYLREYPERYTLEQTAALQYFRKAVGYKELITSWQTEEMWGVVRTGAGDRLLLDVLRNVYDEHETRDDEFLLLSFLLDSFLLQATAFLDFYTLYLCEFFQINRQYALGKSFLGRLETVDTDRFGSRASLVSAYFAEKVFATPPSRHGTCIIGWGSIVRDLRHSTVHRDQLVPSFDTNEELVEKKLRDWPEDLKAIQCARFCSDVQGDMFAMVSTLAGVLYDVDWQPGPYVPGMFGG